MSRTSGSGVSRKVWKCRKGETRIYGKPHDVPDTFSGCFVSVMVFNLQQLCEVTSTSPKLQMKLGLTELGALLLNVCSADQRKAYREIT